MRKTDIYFSVDVETDGPIPGPYSLLSFAIVYAGKFDGQTFIKPSEYNQYFYRELKPISDEYQEEALNINGLNRDNLKISGADPADAMLEAYRWIRSFSENASPVLVAYPLSFDWTWLYWYFVRFCRSGSPFEHSRCYDIKTAWAVKAKIPVSTAGRSRLPEFLSSTRQHTHHAIDDAIEQAEIFSNVFQWGGQ